MQSRRRRCVRPSAPEKEPNHFVKVMFPSPIHSKQIRIPDEFITKFGNELKNVATITVPDDRVWEMELKKCENNVYFCDKWQQFAKYYSLGYGSCLCFKYEGDSKFSVIIFDITSVEISYPPSTNGETNTKCLSPMISSKVKTSESQGEIVKSMSKHASKRVEDAANQFNSNNPYFCSKITKSLYPYVISKFAKKYLKPKVPIKIQNSDGDHWEVSCAFCNPQASAMRMVRGYLKFKGDNNLSEGDICVFELINEKPVVLKATMFRAVDYGD